MDKTARERAAADSPQSAARYVRRGSEAMQAIGICHGIRQSQIRALIKWARTRNGILESNFIERFRLVAEGAEHVVYHDEEHGLAIKATHSNRFGHSARNEWLQATPLEYLQRLAWHNILFGDDIRVLGIALFEENYRSDQLAAMDCG
jgi:hypothetical protein